MVIMVGQPVHGLMTMAVQIFLHFFKDSDYIYFIIVFVFAVENLDDNGSPNILKFLLWVQLH